MGRDESRLTDHGYWQAPLSWAEAVSAESDLQSKQSSFCKETRPSEEEPECLFQPRQHRRRPVGSTAGGLREPVLFVFGLSHGGGGEGADFGICLFAYLTSSALELIKESL